MNIIQDKLNRLNSDIGGEVRSDEISLTIYSTDASAYREKPVGVSYPSSVSDIKKIIAFAGKESIPIIPRAAGTSLAGQVVGNGLIVDVSRFLNNILELNTTERWVRVEPGVVLDELNIYLKSHGLQFGPETSTASRCNIGGMIGNNACGLHSLVYGSTRDHLLEVKVILSDGSEATFGKTDIKQFNYKCSFTGREGEIYRNIKEILSDKENYESIINEYPHPSIERRNTGYALDIIADTEIFNKGSDKVFNFASLIAGSEGTLAFITEAKLNLVPVPPSHKALVCVHLEKRNDAFRANLVALKHSPSAVEMMDDRIIALTEGNITQRRNRFFLDGNPGSILIVEFVRKSEEELDLSVSRMISEMKASGFGYAWPVIKGSDISKVWELRKAGLGVLSNMQGDAKPVSLIEDTAVSVEDLPLYMEEIEQMLQKHGKDAVYHAHIGTGELHIRPVLNLKDKNDVILFRAIGEETARIVKKYRGSLSGEHGDGRLRGEFIPIVIGDKNYGLLKLVKKAWDPDNIFNPGKITGTPTMNSNLRYDPGTINREIATYYDFGSTLGVLRAAENCNGSGDCRKSEIIGGLMCPSYMATRDEMNTTRARANVLREYLSGSTDPWNHKEIYDVLDLCLSCKGCKSECPSNVDIAKLKSEFLQHWYDSNHVPLRTLLIAYLPLLNSIGSIVPAGYNFFLSNKLLSGLIKRFTGFSKERSIPLLYKTTLRKWIKRNLDEINPVNHQGEVCLFVDEFTNFNDTETGIKAIKLLTRLNYRVLIIEHGSSARTFISKGLLRKARRVIRRNIEDISERLPQGVPLIGVEPSAILGFRDEYPELAGNDLKEKAIALSGRCFLFDEFISSEISKGRISSGLFREEEKEILVHTHCQQKAIASSETLIRSLSIPAGAKVREIKSGCCGMAGSFGYEKEHYDLSNKIGEMILFPEIRKAKGTSIVAAPGTSCRHHIYDGTGVKAEHPASILYDLLK